MNTTKLRDLLSKATPRPWAIYPGNNLGGDDSAGEYQQLIRNNKIHCPSDAALIVAAVNQYSASIELAEKVRALIDERKIRLRDSPALRDLVQAYFEWEES